MRRMKKIRPTNTFIPPINLQLTKYRESANEFKHCYSQIRFLFSIRTIIFLIKFGLV